MRSILILGLVFTLAAVPVAQAQQIAVPASAEPSVPSIVEVPLPRFQVDPAPAPEIRLRQETVPADAAMRDVSARNVLAIVGGLVIVIALVAFLR